LERYVLIVIEGTGDGEEYEELRTKALARYKDAVVSLDEQME